MKTSDLVVELAACARCEARPGSRCTTVDGRPTGVHAARLRSFEAGWREGYGDGQRNALGLLRRYVERLQNTANLRDPYELVLERIDLARRQFEGNL